LLLLLLVPAEAAAACELVDAAVWAAAPVVVDAAAADVADPSPVDEDIMIHVTAMKDRVAKEHPNDEGTGCPS
jgi:hypothetical protein